MFVIDHEFLLFFAGERGLDFGLVQLAQNINEQVFILLFNRLELNHVVFDKLDVDIRFGSNVQVAHHAFLNVPLMVRNQETVDLLNLFLAVTALKRHELTLVGQLVQLADEVLTVHRRLFILRLVKQQRIIAFLVLKVRFQNLVHELLGDFVLILDGDRSQSNLFDFFLALVEHHGESHHLEGFQLIV